MKQTNTPKKRYRLMDGFWEPYYTCYNETDLKKLAFWIWSLWDWDCAWDDEEFYWPTSKTAIEKIYSLLLKWERDLYYFVEESDMPFEADWPYWWDDKWHNYSRKEILDYAKTRDDLWEYDKDCLVEFVRWNGISNCWWPRTIDDLLDQFSHLQ